MNPLATMTVEEYQVVMAVLASVGLLPADKDRDRDRRANALAAQVLSDYRAHKEAQR